VTRWQHARDATKVLLSEVQELQVIEAHSRGRMADWLHKEADAYKDALHQVMLGRNRPLSVTGSRPDAMNEMKW
jgi:hypothetical protein